MGLDHCTIVPIAVVGTFWSVARRTMLREATVALGAVTARNVLWNVLSSPKTVACRSLLSGILDARPAGHRGPLRVVDLADLAVDPILREVAAADEQAHAIVRAVVHLAVEVLEVDLALLSMMPRSAAVTIGNPSVSNALPSTATPSLPQTSLANTSAFGLLWLPYCVFNSNVRRAARRGDDVDHAAHAVVAVQARARAVDDLDAIDALERNARPVDPAAERIVERHAVHEHERAADAARPDPAQRHALRGRMRRQAAAAPEQAEGRHLPQHIVGHDGRRLSNRLLFDDVGADGDVAKPLLAAGRRDGHRLEERRELEDDTHFPGGLTDSDHSANPPARTIIVRLPSGAPVSVKRPSGPVTVWLFDTVRPQHAHRRAGNGAVRLVPDDPRHGGLGRRTGRETKSKHENQAVPHEPGRY